MIAAKNFLFHFTYLTQNVNFGVSLYIHKCRPRARHCGSRALCISYTCQLQCPLCTSNHNPCHNYSGNTSLHKFRCSSIFHFLDNPHPFPGHKPGHRNLYKEYKHTRIIMYGSRQKYSH